MASGRGNHVATLPLEGHVFITYPALSLGCTSNKRPGGCFGHLYPRDSADNVSICNARSSAEIPHNSQRNFAALNTFVIVMYRYVAETSCPVFPYGGPRCSTYSC